jgi:glycosyltransferase involved in cell wall biosynthesis
LKSKIDYKENEYAILNNYPSKSYINRKRASIPDDLSSWLDGSDYFLWMGGALKKRNFDSVVKAFASIKHTNLKLVIMGFIGDDMKLLITELGVDDKVFSKFVSQDEIPGYVDKAKFSVVMYKNVSMNNWYCEPNRLYQLITRGVPVIVGNNPPLKNIVEETGAGIVLDNDGSDQYSIKSALSKMMNDKEFNKYTAALKGPYVKNLYSWESQIYSILKRILN